MNIHYIGPEKVETGMYRRRKGEKGPTSKGTEAPRQRAGQTYAGGKHLRKATANLSRRIAAQQATVNGMSKGKSVNPAAYQMPGSMKRKS